MANDVFANGREISCKKADGKSICAFPDVCMTPPENPATPPGVPVPYPNTGFAKDTTSGSKSVKISGQEVVLKNKSYFKKSVGDESGCAAKKGVITSVNRGKVYFSAWSMDVKFEGENIVRNLDLTTHNHASVPSNSPTWPYIDEVAMPGIEETCKEDRRKEKDACKNCSPSGDKDPCGDDEEAKKCQEARKCMLVPYRRKAKFVKQGENSCCPGKTGHHLIPKSYCKGLAKGKNKYSKNLAPCICVEGRSQRVGSHGQLHSLQEAAARKLQKNGKVSYEKIRRASARSARWIFIESGCSADCMEAQLDAYHQQVGAEGDSELECKRILGSNEATPSQILSIGKKIINRLKGR